MKQTKMELDLPLFNGRNSHYPDEFRDKDKDKGTLKNSGSLGKYTKSPYMQSTLSLNLEISQGFALPRKVPQPKQMQQTETVTYMNPMDTHLRSKSNMSISYEERDKDKDRGNKFRLPKISMDYLKNQRKEKQKQKFGNSSLSATLEASTKKKKLSPININGSPQTSRSLIACKTKAGTNGSQPKTNQDIAIIQTQLPCNVQLYCVCDGHGLNGHLVSSFIKVNLLSTQFYKQRTSSDRVEEIWRCLALTNDQLLNSQINTQLSGSTLVAVFIHNQIAYCFNVGDSRAILVQSTEDDYKAIPLSIDQKPNRQDEKQRILKFGGRVDAQRNQRGQVIGPLRVWMKDVQMPGLAMTRSFGDKAGIKAGTNGEPQLITHPITNNDKFIVVASDGVWEYLENEEVINIALPFFKKNDLEMAAQKIVKISTQIWHKISYSRDDITIIIVNLSHNNSGHREQLKNGDHQPNK